MNPVFDLALHMARNPMPVFDAESVLNELGAESVKSFNDDDFYTYNAETLELQPGRGAHYERPTQPAAPLKTVRGMRAKHLGLWQYKVEVAA